MNIEKQITKLCNMYYGIVGLDHHKDRDCHFYISKTWSYGNSPIYKVEHYGYCNNEFTEEFDSPVGAHKYLLAQLTKFISNEKDTAQRILDDSSANDYDINIANNTLKIIRSIE